MAGKITTDKETFLSVLGEGLHTGFRKGINADSSEAGEMWSHISKLDPDVWNNALDFLMYGLEAMNVVEWDKE